MYVADTETTRNNDGSMRVWLWDICIIGEPYTHTHGTDITDMMRFMFSNPDLYYFHNIKYDGSYILYWLNDNGYKFVDKSVGEPGTYSALITDRNVWFSLVITNFDGITIELHDSYKKLVMSVEKVAEAYKLPMSKGEIDYKADRPVGYTPTAEELSYVERDTEIVARALFMQYQQGLDKMTAPACALDAYKHMVDFEKLFCTKWWNTHRSAETFCRKAYAGGISWVNPILQEKECKHGLVYDYNSMYPSVMLMYPYPIGCPCRWYDEPPKNDYNLYIARCRVNILLNDGCPACIRDPIHKNWVTAYDGELYLTNIDIELLQQNYSGECELLDGYAFRSEKGIFDCYIEYWANIKRNSRGAMRTLAKLMLNSRFGKLMSGTHYADYAIDNSTLIDLSTFVVPRDKHAKCIIKILTDMGTLYLWIYKCNVWLSTKGDSTAPAWSTSESTHTEGAERADFAGSIGRKFIKAHYANGTLFFDSDNAKAIFSGACTQFIK